MRPRQAFTLAAAGLSLWGCATVDPQPQWQKLEAITAERTEGQVVWERTEADAEAIQNQVSRLLADGLTQQEAVGIALLNNRTLQAAFEDLGMAQADLTQAGLLTNPSLDLFFAFPLVNGESFAALLGSLSNLWTVPARKKVFARQAQAILRQVGMAVVDTAAEAATAYNEMLYRKASLAMEQAMLKVLSETAQEIKIYYDHGLANDLELRRAETALFDQQLAAIEAKRDLTTAKVRLDAILSLPDAQTGYRLADTLESLPEDTWDTEKAVAFAMEHRLDLAQARIRIEQAEHQLAFERTQLFRRVNIGPAYQGDLGAGPVNSEGPALSLDLPIFDQNQAQIAKAEYRLRQTKKALTVSEMRTRKEVTELLAEITANRNSIMILRDKTLPALEQALDYTQTWGVRMQLSLLYLLQTRELEILRKRQYLQALWQFRAANVRLHRALWGGSAI